MITITLISTLSITLSKASENAGGMRPLPQMNQALPSQHKMDENPILTYYTPGELLSFYDILFSDLPSAEQERITYTLREGPFIKKIVYNQQGYDEGVTDLMAPDGQKVIIGNSLTLENGPPIGYNIILPIGEVKGVIVKVCGVLAKSHV